MLQNIEKIPPDPILTLSQEFMMDIDPKKVDLGIGLYRDECGSSPIMESVKIAERLVVNASMDKVYKGSSGHDGYCSMLVNLLFGHKRELIEEGRVFSFQTIGGTGAVRLSAEIINQVSPCKGVWVSDPTWDNHKDIFLYVGMKVFSYPYQGSNGELDFHGMLDEFKRIPEGDVVILHGCGHNPTGLDLSKKQWGEILSVIMERGLFPIIDMAYHGLSRGLKEDSYCVDLFSDHLDEMFVAYSCSKNFGLYRDRVGALLVLGNDRESCSRIKLQLAKLTRINISSPAIHGALVVNEILASNELGAMWENDISSILSRVLSSRKVLLSESQSQGCGDVFHVVSHGVGLFSMLPIRSHEVRILRDDFSVYMLNSGRINVSGVNQNNVEYIVSSFKSVLNN